MNTKRMVTNAILISIGAILHQITPPFGMQADFSLAMLFIIIIFNKEYKNCINMWNYYRSFLLELQVKHQVD